jgi:hypothetical protein
MSIPEHKIEAVMRILSAWNPLGASASDHVDLDGYRTEATDILAEISSERTAPRIVQEVISEAFNIDVSIQDCHVPAREIWRVNAGPSR